MTFELPSRIKNPEGNTRRVGVEFEFAGMELAQACSAIQELFGGEHIGSDPYVHHVRDTRLGDFSVEIDTAILKDRSYETVLRKLGVDIDSGGWRGRVEDLLSKIAGTVVPHEVVCPPVPMTELDDIESLRELLHRRQALGTHAGVLYAFGLHLNPEVPTLEAAGILAYLRAFLLLEDWLRAVGHTDFSRRVTPFINEFPEDYRRYVLGTDYTANMERMITDYVRFNPTRNRPLDMLPLFAQIAGIEALKGVEDLHLVNARPTFHYRLPNCRIDEADWSVEHEWRGWLAVERLADDPDRIRAMSRDYLGYKRDALPLVDPSWLNRLERHWL